MQGWWISCLWSFVVAAFGGLRSSRRSPLGLSRQLCGMARVSLWS